MRAKLVKPGKFHSCQECGSASMVGEPMLFDGWIDKDKDFIGTVVDYPTREDAEGACDPEYHPVERMQVWLCGNQCRIKPEDKDAKLKIFEIWSCGNCDYKTQSKEEAAGCCL